MIGVMIDEKGESMGVSKFCL